ncbi:uncharacterized protein LOC120645034 isoform X2 [Panicum virgatum]|uniref:uncharacterized protein LOC120645034 isoform X2 n=1 Tax=Panicum virgatum TaxID=38727 RepID=UPI0019D5E3C6|nr:uncharacterized protein LOC120645034 isoform X2 [Panicum virgatum]
MATATASTGGGEDSSTSFSGRQQVQLKTSLHPGWSWWALKVCLAVYLSYVFFLRMHSGCSYYYACQDKLCKEFTGKAAKLQCASLLRSAQNCPHSHIHRSAETLHQHTSSKHGFARRTTHDSHAHSLAIDQLVQGTVWSLN